ncbi:hypothetical protein [Jatrophihabitans fulvus]
MTLLVVTALWLVIAVCVRAVPRRSRPQLADRTGARVVTHLDAAPVRHEPPAEFASACDRRFTALEVHDWARFADLRAREALRTSASAVTVSQS